MLAIALFAILGCASAAPYHHHSHHHHRHNHNHNDERFMPFDWNYGNYMSLDPFIYHDEFDTERFWHTLSQDMAGIDLILDDFYKYYPRITPGSDEGIYGNEYIIKIPLVGYNGNKLIIKKCKNLLAVQAMNEFGSESNRVFIDFRILPDCVRGHGTWKYDGRILVITFPLYKNNDENGKVPIKPVIKVPVPKTPATKTLKPVTQATPIPRPITEAIPGPTQVTEEIPAPTQVTEEIPAPTQATEEIPAPTQVTEAIPAPTQVTEEIPGPTQVTEEIPAPKPVTQATEFSGEQTDNATVKNESDEVSRRGDVPETTTQSNFWEGVLIEY